MYYTCNEVAKMFRVTHRSVLKWITTGKLSAIRAGRDYRIPKEAVDEFVKQAQVQPHTK